MVSLYRPFFLFYGGVHVVAGLLIAISPSLLNAVFIDSTSGGVATIIGFLSALAGLGFFGGAFVVASSERKRFVILCIAGNVLNALAHVTNTIQMYSPDYMLAVGVAGPGFMILLLAGIYRALGK